jgi:hypothetical protein
MGARHRHFLALMVGAPGFSDITSQLPTVNVFEHLWWALPNSPTAPPRGLTVDIF